MESKRQGLEQSVPAKKRKVGPTRSKRVGEEESGASLPVRKKKLMKGAVPTTSQRVGKIPAAMPEAAKELVTTSQHIVKRSARKTVVTSGPTARVEKNSKYRVDGLLKLP